MLLSLDFMTTDLRQAEILFSLSGTLRGFPSSTTNCSLPILLFQIVDISLGMFHTSGVFLQISSRMSRLAFRRDAYGGVFTRGSRKCRLCFSVFTENFVFCNTFANFLMRSCGVLCWSLEKE